MKQTVTQRSLVQSETLDSGEFSISSQDAPHIMRILRDTLYSDKILAVIREYSSNAWDAHVAAGKKDLPIKVKMPTRLEPTFSIRDYGHGLSREGVLRVYTRYGASTKRDSDDAVGMLGIGSKSGFAYADSFVIISYHNCVKSMYVAVLDPSDKGVINLMHEEPCSKDETGVEIQIAVDLNDINEFTRKASNFFRYFKPRPEINIDIPSPPSILKSLKNGDVYKRNNDHYYYNSTEWHAIMGCVPYSIDINQIRSDRSIPEFIYHMTGVLYFDIGEVNVSASREALKYTDQTKKSLKERFKALAQEYVDTVVNDIDNKKLSLWEKRLALQPLKYMHSSLPPQMKDLTDSWIELKSVPKEILTMPSSLNTTDKTRFVIHDDPKRKSLRGFDLAYSDVVVKRTNSDLHTWDVIEKALNDLIDAHKLTGIPVVKTSTLTWIDYNTNKPVANIKHRLTKFVFDGSHNDFTTPYSHNWLPDYDNPTDDDVYVEIENFLPVGMGTSFMNRFRIDKLLCDRLGITMPKIYAYKVTKKKPSQQRQGKKYEAWRDELAKKAIVHPAIAPLFQAFVSWRIDKDPGYIYERGHAGIHKDLEKKLGSDHIIVKFVQLKIAARKISITNEVYHALNDVAARVDYDIEINKLYKEILQKYAILSTHNNSIADVLIDDDLDKWVDYIKMIDGKNKNESTDVLTNQ